MKKKFKIETGSRGGQFYRDEKGKIHCIKPTDKKYIEVK